MEHPFLAASSLADKSVDELQTSITSLLSKLTFAQRSGNQPMVHQISMVLESYNMQYNKKMDAILQKQLASTAHRFQTKKE